MSCEYRVKINGKGCKFYEFGTRGLSGFCTNSKAKYYRCIDWIASVKYEKLMLSHSQRTAWERCPFMWSLEQIEGIEVRPEFNSLPLRMGNEIQVRLSGVGTRSIFHKHEWEAERTVDIFVDIIKENEMLPGKDEAEWELKVVKDGFRGNIDCVQADRGQFIEIKFGGNPDFYMTKMTAKNQLEDYCFLRPDLKRGIMCPIRRPELKLGKLKDEQIEDKIARVRKDVDKRINHYFPYFDPDKKAPKWGKVFGKHEFHLDELKVRHDWTRLEIQLACDVGYFIQKDANCTSPFECDYLSICNTGGINWDRYQRKVFDGDRESDKD